MSKASLGRKALAVLAASIVSVSAYGLPAQATPSVTPNGNLESFTTTVSTNTVFIPSGNTTVTITDTQKCFEPGPATYMWHNFISGFGSNIQTINEELGPEAVLSEDGLTATSTKTYNLTLPGEYDAYSYGAGMCGVGWFDPNTNSYYETNHQTIQVYDTPSIYNEAFGDANAGDYIGWSADAYGWGMTYTVSAGTLPAGLTLDPQYGTINGQVTTGGAYDFTITATNPVGSDSQQYTGEVFAPSYSVTPSQASVNVGESVSFVVDAPGENLSAFFIEGKNFGDGPVATMPGSFNWSMVGCGRDVVATFRVYDLNLMQAEGYQSPTWETPYIATADVTFIGDGSGSACFGDAPTGPTGFAFDKETLTGPGDTATLSYTGDPSSEFSCIKVDGVIVYCTPVQIDGSQSVTWEDFAGLFSQIGADPSVSHTVSFSLYSMNDLDYETSAPIVGSVEKSNASIVVNPEVAVSYTVTVTNNLVDEAGESQAYTTNAPSNALVTWAIDGVITDVGQLGSYSTSPLWEWYSPTSDIQLTLSIWADGTVLNVGDKLSDITAVPLASATSTYSAPTVVEVPGQVGGPTIDQITDSGARISWNAASGATSYNVYINGVLAGTTTDLSFDVAGLVADTYYTVTVDAVNDAGSTAGVQNGFWTSEGQVTIVDAPSFGNATVSLNAGTVGSSFSGSVNAAGTGVTYAVKAGSTLPAGLTLDPATGVVSGTPTTAGSYSFVVVASNDGGSAEVTVSVTVNAAVVNPPTPPTVVAPSFPGGSTVALTGGTAGASFSGSVSANGDAPVYSIKSGSTLPAGLSINPATGAITGTPTTAGSYSFIVVATNSAGSAEVTVTLLVASAPVTPPVIVTGKTIKVTFGPDSAKLSTSTKQALKSLVAYADRKGLTTIVVTAYAKKVVGGSAATRNKVAKARAAAIVKYIKSLDSDLKVSGKASTKSNQGRTATVVLKDETNG